MSLKILFVTATETEADILNQISGIHVVADGYKLKNIHLKVLVTGVGSVATSWNLTKVLSSGYRPDLAINAGIAGSFKPETAIGQVVLPVKDRFADLGVETPDGFLTLAEAGLADPGIFPFTDGAISADNQYISAALGFVNPVNAITVNTASGANDTIEKLKKKYDPDIETMEGATFFYICTREKIPFLALRSISNMVEPRDKSKWNILLALNELAGKLKELLITI